MSPEVKFPTVAKSDASGLALWSGGVLAALLVVSGIILRDREPVGLAFGALLALGCTRVSGGRIGYALLALLGADVAFFTVAESASNLVQPSGLLALTIPTTLAATALLVLAGSLTALLGRPLARVLVWRLVFAAAAFVVAVLVTGIVLDARGQPAGPSRGIHVRTQGQAFSQTRLAAPAGDVTLTLSNGDLFYHTFTVDELGVNVIAPVGGERTVTFKAPPGTYRYYCAVPGHAALGMEGTLVVR
jgi:plastocyanin